MTTAPIPARLRRGVALAALFPVGVAAALTGGMAHSSAVMPHGAAASLAADVWSPTTVRVATFNMLGYNHTAPGGNRKGWADGLTRTTWATQIMRNQGLQIVGLQEFQVPQFHKFVSLVGSTYGVYPGVSMGGVPVQNSLVWRKDLYTAVETHTMKVPYFRGVLTPMPYVLLRNNASGQEVWVYNSHNPADSAGDARVYRQRAVAKEIRLVNRLETDYPGVPVINLGDKNDRAPYLCPIMRGTDLRSASGGSLTAGACNTPYPMYADWVTGNSGVTFTHYKALYTAKVRRTTDHHVLMADATLNAPSPAAVAQHVVVIDIQGLRGRTISAAKSPMPTLSDMVRHGSGTTNARTDYATVDSVPNVLGLLTARPSTATTSATSGQLTQGYLPSVFDSVHDAGLRTGFWTSSPSAWKRLSTRWDAANGAPDRQGFDNGRDKVSAQSLTRTDKSAMSRLTDDLRTNRTAFSLAVLSSADKKALRYGGTSPEHAAALAAIDRYLRQLRTTVKSTPSLAGSTTIIVTSDHGAVSRTRLRADLRAAYRVPVVAWGAGVARGSALYQINPQFPDPHGRRIADGSTGQPIRLAYLGNLATRLLGVEAITGGSQDSQRTMVVNARD